MGLQTKTSGGDMGIVPQILIMSSQSGSQCLEQGHIGYRRTFNVSPTWSRERRSMNSARVATPLIWASIGSSYNRLSLDTISVGRNVAPSFNTW